MNDVLKISGAVRRGTEPLEGAYIDLIDPDGTFIAERRTGPDGTYSFHTTPGTWTLVCRAAGTEASKKQVEGSDNVAADFDV